MMAKLMSSRKHTSKAITLAYEKDELEAMVESIQADERPLETAMCALEDNRDLDELQKIIEARMVDLN